MKKMQAAVSVLLLVLLMAACAPATAPVPAAAPAAPAPITAPAAPAAAPAATAREAWQVEWEETIAAAKREGTLTLYVSMGPQQRLVITAPFGDKYGLRVESVTGGTSQLAPKVAAERRAGIYAADVMISGSTSYRYFPADVLEPFQPALILPELTQPELIKKTWYFGEVPWANKARNMIIGLMQPNLPVIINTTFVKADEIKSYKDLLNPKWKGKISLQDPRLSGAGNNWFTAVLALGDVDVNFMREFLTKQEVFITKEPRLMLEWLAHGKHSIAIGLSAVDVTEFTNLGVPLRAFNPGSQFVSGGTSGISMFTRAPHPNAAKLFLNWDLSQEGATYHSKAVGSQSQRFDVPTSHLEEWKVMKPGLKPFRSDDEDYTIKRADYYTPLAKELLASAGIP